jgi:hypothetical protein
MSFYGQDSETILILSLGDDRCRVIKLTKVLIADLKSLLVSNPSIWLIGIEQKYDADGTSSHISFSPLSHVLLAFVKLVG